MESIPSSAKSSSTRSSTESIAESVLRTPLDVEHPSPPGTYSPVKSALTMASSRIETLSKHSNMLPAALRHQRHRSATVGQSSKNSRRRTMSTTSVTSTSSQTSLLRTTLMMVTRPFSSREVTPDRTSSLLTSRTSISSLASIPPSRCISIPQRAGPIEGSQRLAAEATTALLPSTATSLAQFSPTPRASPSLLRFGVSNNARSKSLVGETRRSLGRVCSGGGDDSDRFIGSTADDGNKGPNGSRNWFLRSPDLPSISRALEPDEQIGQLGLHVPTTTPTTTGTGLRSSLGVPITPASAASRVITPGQPLPGTPRPPSAGIKPPRGTKKEDEDEERETEQIQVQVQQMQYPPNGSARDKGKGRAQPLPPACPPPPEAKTVRSTSYLAGFGSSCVIPAEAERESSSLPTLEAIESGSRLMRGKLVCSTCGDVGPDFPRCGRCYEAWCSRECRLHANKKTGGGKHKCASSVA